MGGQVDVTNVDVTKACSDPSSLRRHLKTYSCKKNKCKQRDFASFYESALRTQLKTHSGEKSNKCHQCDFASSQAGDLRTHLKTHSREKSKKCKKCDFASSYVSSLRTHLECTVAKSQTNATNATMHALIQGHWGHIWKRTVEKSQTNATNVTLPSPESVTLGNWSHETACKIVKWTNTRNPKIFRVSPECVGDMIQLT